MRLKLQTTRLAAVTVLASCAFQLADAATELVNGKLSSISSAGISEAGFEFPSAKTDRVLPLSSSSTLKLAFGTSDTSSQPGYAALIFSAISPKSLANALSSPTNASADNLFRRANSQVGSVSVYLAPKKGGKYRWEWDLTTTPREDILSVVRKGDGRLKAQLFLSPAGNSDSSDDQPVLLDLGTVHFSDEGYWKTPRPTKFPREWEMDRYSVRPELHWTFRPPTREIGAVKAVAGTGAVLAPWLALAALTTPVLSELQFSFSPVLLPFLASLGALEAAIVAYWVGIITVWRFMPLVAAAGLAALLTGNRALGEKMRRRLQVYQNENIVKMQ